MATKTQVLAQLEKIGPDEELFLLRAQDILFTKMVNKWADEANGIGVAIPKIQEARACAYRGSYHLPKKIPD